MKKLYVFRGLPGCLPGNTEVMTPGGWMRIDRYKEGTQILQWDSHTNKAEFALPMEYIVGECHDMLHIQSGRVDMTLTENHRVPLYNWAGKFVVKSAEQVATHPSSHIVPATWIPSSSGVPMSDAQLRLWVAVAADGHYCKQGTLCELQVYKERKATRMRKLLEDAGVQYREATRVRKEHNNATVHRFTFTKPDHPKHFDWRLSAVSADQARVIAEEIHYWDGTFDASDCEEFYTSVRQDADIVQYIYHAAGRVTALRKKTFTGETHKTWHDSWRVCPAKIGSQRNKSCIRADHTDVSHVTPDDGKCYCFRTATTFFVVRQNGRIFITGNSGKTTLARQMASMVIEPDMFRYNSDMEYVFDSDKNKEVMKKTQDLVGYAVRHLKMPAVAVTATHTKVEHIMPYVNLGKKHGYSVCVVECYGDYGNVHNVPDHVIAKMAKEFEPITRDMLTRLEISCVRKTKGESNG